ncbi:hypothetical protein SFRURICE_006530 [Spodoptera frugiperda]|nr:hypothetical protein SFRURICE_006530 [Spodoptera frugiperda]
MAILIFSLLFLIPKVVCVAETKKKRQTPSRETLRPSEIARRSPTTVSMGLRKARNNLPPAQNQTRAHAFQRDIRQVQTGPSRPDARYGAATDLTGCQGSGSKSTSFLT